MASKKTNTVRKTKAKARPLQPAVRYLRYRLTNGDAGVETSHFIDLARDLSRTNRRLYRQGREYHVKRISVISTNTISGVYNGAVPGSLSQQDAGFISVSTVPHTWVAANAWKRGFQAWSNMNKDAMRKTNDIAGTWADFKVFMTNDMRTGTMLQPVDNGNALYLAGEWDYSRYVAPTAAAGVIDEYSSHLMGAHVGAPGAYTSIGLIQSYGDARATVGTFDPSVPPTVDDDPLVNLFDYGDTQNQLITNLDTYNDNPPYDHFEYPGDDANASKPNVVGQAALALGSATIGSFSAMCGLIEVESFSPIAGDVYSILVELHPGKYRGIKAGAIE